MWDGRGRRESARKSPENSLNFACSSEMSSSEPGVSPPEQNQDGEVESMREEREESDLGAAVENGDSAIGYKQLEVEEKGERVEAANYGLKQPEISFGTERDVEGLNDLDAVERDSDIADDPEEQPILNQQQRHVLPLEDSESSSPPPVGKPYLSVSPSNRTGYEDLDQPMEENPPPSAYEPIEDSSSSESDEEEGGGDFYGTAGYMLLPAEPEQESKTDSAEGQPYWLAEQDEEGEGEGEGEESTQDSVPMSTIEETQVSAIRQAMANFSLPSSSVPQWAKVVPEDVWKAKLIGGLKKKQEDPNSKNQ